MLGATRTMKWWEEWQLRILVLGSLFIQFILFFGGTLRNSRKAKFIVWLAYIVGDAVAIYALATIFSRQKLHKTDEEVKAGSLEVVWVPVLLIHLGGQFTISAYSLEDNELWRRHVITLVTQVTVAMYVFCKWWSGDGTLLVAAILLFVIGIIKFAEKPWALRRASFERVQSSSSSLSPPRKQTTFAAYWTWCTSNYVEYNEALKNRRMEREECESLEDYVQKASKAVQDTVAATNSHEEGGWGDWIDSIGHTNYFVDVIAPYSVRLTELQCFLKLDAFRRYQFMERYFATKFSIMYSNSRTFGSPLGTILHVIAFPCLGIASVVLFAKSRKDGFNVNDIRVTYVLFCGAAALDLSLYLLFILVCFPNFMLRCFPSAAWVFQSNLLSYYARKKKPTFLMKLAPFNFLRDLVNKSWYVGHVQSARDILQIVTEYAVFGWKIYINGDAARYKRFNNFRGQLILNINGQMEEIGWSLSTRFDESVLVWHIATDLCLHYPTENPQILGATELSRHISNYMMYLLFTQPEVLIPGARPSLYSSASDEIDLLLGNSEALDGEESIARAILKAKKTTEGTLVHRACKLAEALMGLDQNTRCRVIQGVWTEMLCYSVSRRRGYLQIKSMGGGKDILVHVWVLWAFMGMETWVERYHRFEHSEEDGGAGGVGAAAAVGGGEEAYCMGVSSSSGSHTSSWEADQSEGITAV
ncbi:unnamed protein product [Urochloa decumbens]|uniref:DUF4220 domain-containing protein n=1 Tax=Urochloa decumbens TaxID=240449 RepID=A0ABC8ZU59_9POAL